MACKNMSVIAIFLVKNRVRMTFGLAGHHQTWFQYFSIRVLKPFL